MDLTSLETIKEILSRYSARPSKTMGQNFLISRAVLQRIIDASNLSQEDIVLEVGPGIGTLTKELAQRTKQVIAVEKDPRMAQILPETLKNHKNIKFIHADILKINPTPYILNAKPYKLVANIPYYITAPLVRKFLEIENKPQMMVLMVQKEVAKRICAKPPDMSLLAVSVQFYADAKIICYVPKNCFWPKPKVDSAIIKIIPKQIGRSPTPPGLFFKIVKAGFSHPRKQLVNNLSNSLKKDKEKISKWLLASGIEPKQRAETLFINDWKKLTNDYTLNPTP